MEELCNCQDADVYYDKCLICQKSISWETWITYWENKVKDEKHKRSWK